VKRHNVFVSSDPCRPPPLLFLRLILLSFQIKIIASRLKNLVVVNTSHIPDNAPNSRFPFAFTPDCQCSVYTTDHKAENFDLSWVDFIIEFKKGSSDPFVDDSNGNGKGQGKDNPFLRKEGPNREVRGLLTAYATAILGAQYRTHLFMVLIVGEYARLYQTTTNSKLRRTL
jgi:hypothetical protein